MKIKKITRFFSAIMRIRSRKALTRFIVTSETTNGFDSRFKISYSQGFEDLAILGTLPNYSNGRNIDVGCHHPSDFSITRLLYQRGWSGINIDASQDSIDLMTKHRTRDTNICAAVGLEKEYEFHVMSQSGMSTVNEKWKNHALNAGLRIIHREKVKGITLRSIYDQYFPRINCQLLNIDIEGADFECLSSLFLENLERKRYPSWIMLETFPPVNKALGEKSVKYAMKFGYTAHLVLPMSTLLKSPEP